MNTLEKITEELMLSYFFQQLVNSIREVNRENTLKVLVRCNVLLYHREHLLSIFQLIEDREVILKTLKMPLRSDKTVSDTKSHAQWQAIRNDKENDIRQKVVQLKHLTEQVIMSIVDLIRDKRIFGNVFIFKGMNYLKVAQKEMIQVEKIMVMFGVKISQKEANNQQNRFGYNSTITNKSGTQHTNLQTINTQNRSQFSTIGQQNAAINATPIKEVGEDIEEENQFNHNSNNQRSSLLNSNNMFKQGSNSCSQIRNTVNTQNPMLGINHHFRDHQVDGQSITQQTLDIEKINKEVQNEEIKNLYNATAQYDNPLSQTSNVSGNQYQAEKQYNYTQKIQNQRLKAQEYIQNPSLAKNVGTSSSKSQHKLDLDLVQLNKQNQDQLQQNQRGILQIKRHSEILAATSSSKYDVNTQQQNQLPMQYQSTVVQQVSESMFDEHNHNLPQDNDLEE